MRFPKLKSDVAFDPNQPKSLLEILHSGGQTGVERAALDAAAFFQFPSGGWCPKGRKNDDGIIPRKFKLKETESEENLEQTEFNVRDSDASLILSYGDSIHEVACKAMVLACHDSLKIIDLYDRKGSILLS